MTRLTRRNFAALAGASLAAPLVVRTARLGQARPKVVVIGGGAGGATAARYIAKDAAGAIDVTLVEPSKQLHHLLPLQPLSSAASAPSRSITHGYDKLARGYGIKRRCTTAPPAIDRDKKHGDARRRHSARLRPPRGRRPAST